MVYQVKNADDLSNHLQSAGNRLVVMDFFATWCGPCVRFAPTYQRLSTEYTDVLFLKIDVDECQDLSNKYNVRSMPTFILLRGGNVVDRFSGADETRLRESIQRQR